MTVKSSTAFKTACIAAVLTIGLSACGGENNFVAPPVGTVTPPPGGGGGGDNPPTGDTRTPQQQSGQGFADAFNQGEFSEPIDPVAGDINAIDITADPINILPDP